MRLLDVNHPFFARAWVRWATVLLPVVWALAELYGGSIGWAVLAIAVAVYAYWVLILRR